MSGYGTTRTYWAVCGVTAFGGTAHISQRRDNTAMRCCPVQHQCGLSVEASVIYPTWLPIEIHKLTAWTLLEGRDASGSFM